VFVQFAPNFPWRPLPVAALPARAEAAAAARQSLPLKYGGYPTSLSPLLLMLVFSSSGRRSS
jgi:hypothetical protein